MRIHGMKLVSMAVTALTFCGLAGMLPAQKSFELTSSLSEKGEFLIAHLPAAYAEEGEIVTFGVVRTFGVMPLGDAECDADGVAKFGLPRRLLQDLDGGLTVTASYAIPDEDKTLEARLRLDRLGDERPAAGAAQPPRELWSSRPPLSLLLTIIILYGSVWTAYAVAFSCIVRIKRLGTTPAGGKQG